VHHHPYRLRVIAHAEANKQDFYTLSSGGLSHVCNGLTEFTDMASWRSEQSVFHKIRQLPMFYNFRKWKAFHTWRKRVFADHVAARRKRLSANLFVLQPTLRQALLRVRALCLDIVEARLCRIDPARTYSLEEFVATQQTQVDDVMQTLVGFRTQVGEIAFAAARATLDLSGFPKASADEAAAGADEAMPFTDQARKRDQCGRLTHFIRLVDMLVANAMQALAVESLGFLRDHLGALRAGSAAAAAAYLAEKQAAAAAAAGASAAVAQAKKKGGAATDAPARAEDATEDAAASLAEQAALVEVCGEVLRVTPLEAAGAKKTGAKRAGASILGKRGAVVEAMPLLRVQLELCEDAIFVHPQVEDVRAEVLRLAQQFQAVVGVEALLTDELFQPFTSPIVRRHNHHHHSTPPPFPPLFLPTQIPHNHPGFSILAMHPHDSIPT